MAGSEISAPIQKVLLRRYEPVLRFSAGENFFPMRVDWFVANSRLSKYNERSPDTPVGNHHSNDVTIDSTTVKECMQELVTCTGKKGLAYQLSFVPRNHWYRLTVLVLLLFHAVALMWYVHKRYIGDWGLHGVEDFVRMGAVLLAVVLWPLAQANRKVHMAVVFTLFALLFFGSPLSAAAGLATLFLILGVWLVSGVTALVLPLIRRPQFKAEWVERLLKTVLIGAGFIAVLVVSFLVTRELMEVLGARGTFVRTDYILHEDGSPTLRSEDAASMLVVYGLVLAGVWLWVGAQRDTDNPRSRLLGSQSAHIRVLAASTVWFAIVWLATLVFGLHTHPDGRKVRAFFLLLQIGVVFFWFFSHPLQLVKGDAYLTIDNERLPTMGLRWKMLLVILLAAILWTASTFEAINRASQPGMIFRNIIIIAVVVALGSDVVRYWADIRSPQPDTDAKRAARRYQQVLNSLVERAKGTNSIPARFAYYGRASDHEDWVVLQYHYFYAYNDYRSNARGLNNHEGDWEAVSVFLQRRKGKRGYGAHALKPFGVAYSQHHDGKFCFWDGEWGGNDPEPEDSIVKKVVCNSDAKAETTHPLVYPALGSHANFPWPDLYPTSSHFKGFVAYVLREVDRILATYRPHRHYRDWMEAGLPEPGTSVERTKNQPAGLPVEFAAGDGLRIGINGLRGHAVDINKLFDFTEEFKWPSQLPYTVDRHGTKRAQEGSLTVVAEGDKDGRKWAWDELDWECRVIAAEEFPWVEFTGRWGRVGGGRDESGPTGPKWKRANEEAENPEPETRMRWGYEGGGGELAWMETLLFQMLREDEVSLEARKWALKTLQFLAPECLD